MKIMFMCSSLEPGRDGVGDYTRLLAEGCIALGLECCRAPSTTGMSRCLSNPSIGRRHADLAASGGHAVVQTCGIGDGVSAAKRSPDWISLQFVSYGFAGGGLVWNLGARLRRIVEGMRGAYNVS